MSSTQKFLLFIFRFTFKFESYVGMQHKFHNLLLYLLQLIVLQPQSITTSILIICEKS